MQYCVLTPEVVLPHSVAAALKTAATVLRVADVDDLKYSVSLAAAPLVAAVAALRARAAQLLKAVR